MRWQRDGINGKRGECVGKAKRGQMCRWGGGMKAKKENWAFDSGGGSNFNACGWLRSKLALLWGSAARKNQRRSSL